jgi:hypothetical protein
VAKETKEIGVKAEKGRAAETTMDIDFDFGMTDKSRRWDSQSETSGW